MLSVGRGINLKGQGIVCSDCLWDGVSTFLKTSLVPVSGTTIFLYVYRCPECDGFDLVIRGKLLPFLKQTYPPDQETPTALVDYGNSKKTHAR
jgi:hypothetical protein